MSNENELTAALATIEKCREVSGCPAGVDLQDHLRQLAAENVGLKSAAEFATAPDMWIEQADGMLDYRYCDWYVDVLKAAMETPATDAYLAGIKADGVEEFAAKLESRGRHQDYVEIANAFAKQLREGAK
ncbi:hypothetical protein DMP59_03615 [Klebsiella pneumoniae]|uniref:hypothetical protein n=1 Tax=Klebsiella pneumoniae TaxID=573 RepID=UPI000D74153E|nr:hypothetical protein DMP59_03615 [Klebsiella pneumoniae]